MASADRPGKLAGLAAQIRAAKVQPPAAEDTAPTASDAAQEPAGATITPPEVGTVAKRGRRAGKGAPEAEPIPKSKDEQFVQVTLFLRRSHYAEAQNRLRTARTLHRVRQDFSDVADALVAGWLEGRFKL